MEKKNPSDVSLNNVMGMSNGEFRVWTYMKLKSIAEKLSWHTVLMLLILGAILGTRLL